MSDSVLPRLSPRPLASHKGNFGRALIIGGSRGMSGAVAMTGMAAVRTGAGLVRLAVPDCCVDTVAGYSPCYMIVPIDQQDSAGRICKFGHGFIEWLEHCDCLAVGPGLGRSELLDHFMVELLQWVGEHRPDLPMVVDADGLNALAEDRQWWTLLRSPTVLTPHPGEWCRLSGVPNVSIEAQAESAVAMAAKSNCTILLKGHRSLITNGDQTTRNQTGTPAMATGGSGDVLTGIITALICQGLKPLDATVLGAHLHGLAGQIAESELGVHVVLPTELIQFLPMAIREVTH